jgi:hypothetical protein
MIATDLNYTLGITYVKDIRQAVRITRATSATGMKRFPCTTRMGRMPHVTPTVHLMCITYFM